MKTEYIVLNQERNVSLTAYLQPAGGEFAGVDRRPAVLVIPGGGYHFCSDREADPVAFPYLAAGYHAFILRYSLGDQAVWPTPLEDYEQAMELIRGNAEAWHVVPDRITVIGFSAGGHLAACAATMSRNRPNAAILGYPVLDGDCARDWLPSAPDVPSAVDHRTCPCFIFATRTDNLVPAGNALHLMNALWEQDIAFESHIYANGPHGLSTGDSAITRPDHSDRYADWVRDSIAWLADVLGGISAAGLTEPRFGSRVNGNREKTLNLDCTMKHLMAHPQGKALLAEILPGGPENPGFPPAAAGVITLRDGLQYSRMSSEAMEALEQRLRTIENIREE